MPGTGLVYDPRCLDHDNGSMVVDDRAAAWLDVAHAENAARVGRAHQVLQRSGVLARLQAIPSRPTTRGELKLVHTDAHVDRVAAACAEPGLTRAGPEARAGEDSWEPALLSAGSALAAVDAVAAGSCRTAYALTRPPGHHASADRAMGFCLFNNAALVARHAQRTHGLQRVAILDWDVHHGNGTQAVFYDDPSVLFVSLHQAGLYPAGEGTVEERGAGPGRGATVNVPLPAGSGDSAYLAAMDRVVLPTLTAFDPDLIVLSSGQDAAASDPLGRMSVTAEGFRTMTTRVVDCAEASCDGRVVAVQEGGYSVDHMPFCVLATVEALAGLEPSLAADPLELDVPDGLKPAEEEAIDAAWKAAR